MPKQAIDANGRRLLDIASYARHGPGRRDRLSSAEVQQIGRTVNRTPEVMIKVLSQGSQNLGAVQRHFDYLGRSGELEIETEDGSLLGKGVEKKLLEDWDLDLEAHRRQNELTAVNGRHPPKLVHKLMFSMPPGTLPDRILAAVRAFAREEFALKHRYAMVLHTDEPHPHVHMVVKAVSEQGTRLNIRKATLREWRREFARHLRENGIAANATERAVRGAAPIRKLDSIYRPMHDPKRHSTHIQERMRSLAADLLGGSVWVEPGKARLLKTREEVERGWRAVDRLLMREGQVQLAAQVRQFVNHMPAPKTEREWLLDLMKGRMASSARRDQSILR